MNLIVEKIVKIIKVEFLYREKLDIYSELEGIVCLNGIFHRSDRDSFTGCFNSRRYRHGFFLR